MEMIEAGQFIKKSGDYCKRGLAQLAQNSPPLDAWLLSDDHQAQAHHLG
jgi:hypothetical protein